MERATSFFYYRKGSDFRRILHLLKYGGQKEIGAIMGRYMAAELIESGFFQGIDVIIPIPLHETKQRGNKRERNAPNHSLTRNVCFIIIEN